MKLYKNPYFYLSFILTGLLVWQVASFVQAQQSNYTGPSGQPPTGTPAQPLDTSSSTQTKTGRLNFNTDGTVAITPTGLCLKDSVTEGVSCKSYWGQIGGASQWQDVSGGISYATISSNNQVGIGTNTLGTIGGNNVSRVEIRGIDNGVSTGSFIEGTKGITVIGGNGTKGGAALVAIGGAGNGALNSGVGICAGVGRTDPRICTRDGGWDRTGHAAIFYGDVLVTGGGNIYKGPTANSRERIEPLSFYNAQGEGAPTKDFNRYLSLYIVNDTNPSAAGGPTCSVNANDRILACYGYGSATCVDVGRKNGQGADCKDGPGSCVAICIGPR